MSKLKEKIRSAKDIKTEKVSVPEWDCEVYVQALNGKKREAYEEETTKINDDGKVAIVHANMRAKLLVKTLREVNEDGSMGEPIFEGSAEDLELLSAKSSDVLERLLKVAQRLSGIGKAAEEDIEKN